LKLLLCLVCWSFVSAFLLCVCVCVCSCVCVGVFSPPLPSVFWMGNMGNTAGCGESTCCSDAAKRHEVNFPSPLDEATSSLTYPTAAALARGAGTPLPLGHSAWGPGPRSHGAVPTPVGSPQTVQIHPHPQRSDIPPLRADLHEEKDNRPSCRSGLTSPTSQTSMRGAGGTTADSASVSSTDGGNEEITQPQAIIKAFVRSLVKGRKIEILQAGGGSTPCIAFLDRKLTELSLARGDKPDGKRRGIPLEDIREIVVGDDVSDDFELYTDELCAALVLESGQAMGCRFVDIEERDTFALCLSMFVDGRRGEITRRKIDGNVA